MTHFLLIQATPLMKHRYLTPFCFLAALGGAVLAGDEQQPAQEAPKLPEKPPEKTAAAVPVKPSNAAAPAPSTTQPTGSWPMLGPGKQTKGRSVTTEQAASLQGRNDIAPLYLTGKFLVSAAGGNRAVLRTDST